MNQFRSNARAGEMSERLNRPKLDRLRFILIQQFQQRRPGVSEITDAEKPDCLEARRLVCIRICRQDRGASEYGLEIFDEVIG